MYGIWCFKASDKNGGGMCAVLRPGRPAVGGVLMFLLMAFGSGEWVGISLLDAGDLLGMAGFIGIFSYALGFLPACLAGAIAGIVHSGIRQLRWFLLLCAVVSAIAPVC
ncbi:hypothetical protein CU560_21740 [Serratia ureilytica]|nr:hypothetical protein CU560_21740 [Serratia ureilytica]